MIKAEGAKILAPAIQDNGALVKLDISSNYKSLETPNSNPSQGSEDFIRPIACMLKTNRTIKEINLAGNNLNAEAGRIFSQDIHDNGALAKLDLSKNYSGVSWESKDFIRPIASMLKTNKTIKELNLAGNKLDAEAARIFSQDIQDNGALASLTFCGNGGFQGTEGDPVTINTTITEANFSDKKLGPAGAQILAAFIERKFFQDNGALAKLDLSGNNEYDFYSPDFIRPIATMLNKTNTSLKELNLAGNKLNAEAARIFSQDIQDNGALVFLTMHKYKLPFKEIKTAKELDLSNKELAAIDAIVIAALIEV